MNSQSSQGIFSIIGGAVIALLILVAFNCFIIINPGQAGVLSILGEAQEQPLLEGLHFRPPLISYVDVYDITVQKFEVPAQSSTKDLQDLNASFAINFRLDPQKIVEIRRKQGTLANIVAKIIAPQTQESFKIAAALRNVEEAITQRNELKEDFDNALSTRLEKYGIIVLDTSVVDLDFSPQFAKAVEDKQIAEQKARKAVYIASEAEQKALAEINRAKGKAEAQKLLAETLKAQGGRLVLEKEAIEAWREGGAQVPKVLVISGDAASQLPFLLNFEDLQ
ncbi:membrane protease subunit, stomatin/prohibitin [Xenococcus sp. PCC 7305]|uniref:prohibitin family protein n=1 Tax=Xenococcus sp. PCC 7305 TaxID=102125 RepID=UPI0002ABAECA|nr:prohibitin family protein [Xenococcus sp. PCC 7305]ELS01578.1 membrane protease subunit, stomatin/prohibitin [Xenococcus sp. PCC 7305]